VNIGNNETEVRKRILCVEDHRDTCEILALVLRRYEFTSVGSLAEARKLIEQRPFDLYIFDNWLPDGSGLDLCREIRSTNARVPIIFTSAAGFQSDIENAKVAGADRYVVKPYEPFSVEQIVKELLDQQVTSPAES
jgi:DNA-binding response OmpR family regulator